MAKENSSIRYINVIHVNQYCLPKEILLQHIVSECDIPELKAWRSCNKDFQQEIEKHPVWHLIAEKTYALVHYEEIPIGISYYDHVKKYFHNFRTPCYTTQKECDSFFAAPTTEGFRWITELNNNLHVADSIFRVWKELFPQVTEDQIFRIPNEALIGLQNYVDRSNVFFEWVSLYKETIEEVIISNHFSFSGLEMRFFPNALCQLTIDDLCLCENQLSTLSEEFGNLSVRFLFLSCNEFSVFPPPILNIHSLELLRMSCNRLRKIPKEICSLNNLTSLNFADNQLTKFPKGISALQALKELWLSNNCIREIPEEITNLRRLVFFKISYNKLSKLSEKIAQLPCLLHLNLSFNQIAKPSEEVISQFSHLATFRIEGNWEIQEGFSDEEVDFVSDTEEASLGQSSTKVSQEAEDKKNLKRPRSPSQNSDSENFSILKKRK